MAGGGILKLPPILKRTNIYRSMAHKKGHTNNPHGRPKGTPNKVTGKLREMITGFLEGEFATIKREFKSLPAKEKARVYADLLNYAIPKLQSTSLDFDFDKLSDDQLDKVIAELQKTAIEASSKTKSNDQQEDN